MQEIITYWRPIAISSVTAVFVSYLYVSFILLMTKVIIIASSAFFPLILLGAGGGFIELLKIYFLNDTFMY